MDATTDHASAHAASSVTSASGTPRVCSGGSNSVTSVLILGLVCVVLGLWAMFGGGSVNSSSPLAVQVQSNHQHGPHLTSNALPTSSSPTLLSRQDLEALKRKLPPQGLVCHMQAWMNGGMHARNTSFASTDIQHVINQYHNNKSNYSNNTVTHTPAQSSQGSAAQVASVLSSRELLAVHESMDILLDARDWVYTPSALLMGVPGVHSVAMAPMSSASDILCLELMICTRVVNLFIPFQAKTTYDISRIQSISSFEEQLRIPMLFPSTAAIGHLYDKSAFTSFMEHVGLGSYIPTMYKSIEEVVTFPVMIKKTQGVGGNGIYVVHSQSDAISAMEKLRSDESYIITEAIPGKIEPFLYFIARHGRLAGAMCLVNRGKSDLYVAGREVEYDLELVGCEAFEAISAVLDLARRIAAELSYNGIASVNFKFAANNITPDQLEAHLAAIPQIGHTEKAVVTDFSQLRSSLDVYAHDAIPKLFEINPRAGSSLFSAHAPELAYLIKAFLRAAASE